MADNLLLTPEEIREEIKSELDNGFVSGSVIDEFIKENAGLLNRLLKAELAKVHKLRLDRPELRGKIADLVDIDCSLCTYSSGSNHPKDCFDIPETTPCKRRLDIADQILALIPTEEEIRKQERERMEQRLLKVWQEYASDTWNIKTSEMLPSWVRQALKEGA